jgi:putative PIN family toxin of toxin-antitoxin system
MKVVVDTNVFISAVFFGGTPQKVLQHVVDDNFSLIVTSAILFEYSASASRFDNSDDGPSSQLLALIISKSTAVEPVRLLKAPCRDPDDIKFLEAAVSAQADFIVSGDKDLLVLKEFRGIKIIKISEFLKLLDE